jgi:hypothetical protein
MGTYTIGRRCKRCLTGFTVVKFVKGECCGDYCEDCRARKLYKPPRPAVRRVAMPPSERRYLAYRRNARQRMIMFSLSLRQFTSMWQRPCTYCGEPIQTIGIDRLDNTRGYEVGNVASCCRTCNQMKSDSDLISFLDRCASISRRMGPVDKSSVPAGKSSNRGFLPYRFSPEIIQADELTNTH